VGLPFDIGTTITIPDNQKMVLEGQRREKKHTDTKKTNMVGALGFGGREEGELLPLKSSRKGIGVSKEKNRMGGERDAHITVTDKQQEGKKRPSILKGGKRRIKNNNLVRGEKNQGKKNFPDREEWRRQILFGRKNGICRCTIKNTVGGSYTTDFILGR